MVRGSDDSRRGSRQVHPDAAERSEGQSLGRCVWLGVPGLFIRLRSQLDGAAEPGELELESVSSQLMEVVRTERQILLPVIKLVVQLRVDAEKLSLHKLWSLETSVI